MREKNKRGIVAEPLLNGKFVYRYNGKAAMRQLVEWLKLGYSLQVSIRE